MSSYLLFYIDFYCIDFTLYTILCTILATVVCDFVVKAGCWEQFPFLEFIFKEEIVAKGKILRWLDENGLQTTKYDALIHSIAPVWDLRKSDFGLDLVWFVK